MVLAWLAVLAVCVAAYLFGQTTRTNRRRRRRSCAGRLGLFLSLSGPWLTALLAAGVGALTGRWLAAAAVGACGVALVAIVGASLHPH